MPTVTSANVVIGVGYLYHAAADTARPTGVGSVPGPAGSAPTGWTYVGATEEGVTLNLDREINDHYVEESSIQVFSTPGNSTFTIELQLAESTLANWKLGVGGGSIASGELTLSDTLDIVALYVDAPAPGSAQRRTVYIPRASSVGGLDVAMRRNESKQLITASFRSACALSEIKIKDSAVT
jgi:hypothetical protein